MSTQQIKTAEKGSTEIAILEAQFADRKSEFQSALPSNCTFERFARIVKTAVIQNHDLLNADRKTFFTSCFKCAQDGLLPDGREAALVVYNNKQKDNTYKKIVQYMPMIAGLLKKVRNSGELASIAAHVAYENDQFEYCLGDDEHIIHKPTLKERGKSICVYTIVKTKDGAIYRDVMSTTDVEKIRSISKAKNSGPWVDHWDEMAKKTVIRRISKRLPMSTDVEQVINRDDEMFEFNNQPKSNAIDTTHTDEIDVQHYLDLTAKETTLAGINMLYDMKSTAPKLKTAIHNKAEELGFIYDKDKDAYMEKVAILKKPETTEVNNLFEE